MDGAAGDRLVHVEVTIANLQVEAAFRVGTNPGLEMNGCTLAAEVGKRHKVTGLTLLALREAEAG